MKFAHLADCHLGSWKDPKMHELNLKAFEKSIEICIKSKVDFVLIAGDLFDAALPPIDILKSAASKLRELKEARIPCFVVAGSHDYSVSGKTFLDVLEKAGLCENVDKTWEEEMILTESGNFVIAGISGKKAELEKELIKKIKIPPMNKDKFKILALHTTLEENKTSEFMRGIKSEDLPKGFDYYALGHIHKPFKKEGKEMIVYPGPLFPNNFSELEELGNGGFFIVNVEGKDNKISLEREDIKLKEIRLMEFSAEGKTPFILTSEIIGKIKKEDISEKIFMLKIEGTLSSGKTSEIDFNSIKDAAKDAFVFLKNTSQLESPGIKINAEIKSENIDEIEVEAFKNIKEDFKSLVLPLFKALDIEKIEGESSLTFEKRFFENIKKVIEI